MGYTINIMNLLGNLSKISNTNLSDNDEVKNAALLMESIILSKDDVYLTNQLLNNYELLKKLQNIYETFETNLEISFTKDIINRGKIELSSYLLYKRFVKLIKNEIALADIKKDDKVLFIGSGPFPITAILINKFSGCSVICVEKDKNRSIISKEVIQSLGLSKNIRVLNGKGENIGCNSFSVAIIALLVKPKSEILDNLSRQAIADARIICRTSDGARQAFYEQANPEIFSRYKIIDKIIAGENQIVSSVLLTK